MSKIKKLSSVSSDTVIDQLNFHDLPDIITDIKLEPQDGEATAIASVVGSCQQGVGNTPEDPALRLTDNMEEFIPKLKSETEISFKTEEIDIKTENEEDSSTRKDQKLEYDRANHNETTIFEAKKSVKKLQKCSECDYQTFHKGHLNVHMVIHKDPNDVSLIKCDQCDFTTKRKSNLTMHITVHKDLSEENVMKCNRCEFRTKWKSNLNKHMRRHKPEEDRYKCNKCDYTTLDSSTIKRHIQWCHKGLYKGEIFKCLDCSYKTIFKSELKGHLLIHKDPNEAKRYKCDLCDYKTIQKSNLTQHLHRHEKLDKKKCNKCDYQTINKRALSKHVRTHGDTQDVQINGCDRCEFKTNGNQV